MRIIFSTDQIYRHGGIEKVMAEKANYFADVCGYEVIILTCEQRNNVPCYPLSSKIKLVDLGINYERSKSYFTLTNLQKLPKHIYKLRKILNKLRANSVIVSNYGFDYYAIPFLNKSSKKIKEFHSSRHFEIEHRQSSVSFINRLLYNFNDYIESRYTNIVLLNPDETKFYKSSNLVVIPNPISIPDVKAKLESKNVIAAGRIAGVKGFDKLIAAWKIVSQTNNDWRLHLYGEDYNGTQKMLEHLIQKYNLQDSIIFKGSTDDIVSTFEKYSIYAMSSETECFPMVLLESLSVGLPIVSFNCPTGPRNIVTHDEDGLLVENQNINDLAESLLKLITDNDKRTKFGMNAKMNSIRFSTDTVMKKWINLLEQ